MTLDQEKLLLRIIKQGPLKLSTQGELSMPDNEPIVQDDFYYLLKNDYVDAVSGTLLYQSYMATMKGYDYKFKW